MGGVSVYSVVHAAVYSFAQFTLVLRPSTPCCSLAQVLQICPSTPFCSLAQVLQIWPTPPTNATSPGRDVVGFDHDALSIAFFKTQPRFYQSSPNTPKTAQYTVQLEAMREAAKNVFLIRHTEVRECVRRACRCLSVWTHVHTGSDALAPGAGTGAEAGAQRRGRAPRL